MSARFTILVLVATIFINACSGDFKEKPNDKKYGGTLRVNLASPPVSLYPPSISTASAAQFIAQFHLCLVKFNSKTLAVEPALARKWQVDTSGTVYTFFLTKNAFFHDDNCFTGGKGRRITAADLVFTFEQLCTQVPQNLNFSSVSLIYGAKKYYQESAAGKPAFALSGVKAINDTVLQIMIEKANPFFLNLLANPACAVQAKEAFEVYSFNSKVGAGAFVLKQDIDYTKPVYLSRNPNFCMADKKALPLPYLDSLEVHFYPSSSKEINLFFKGKLDAIIGLQQKDASSVMEKHIGEFSSTPPKYVMTSIEDDSLAIFNLLHPNIKDLYTNRMNYIDFSIVYFDKP